MSILNVNKINPVGGGSTITISGIASVTSNLLVGGSNLHSTGLNVNNTFVHSTGIALGAGSTIGAVTGVTTYYGDGSQLSGISVDSAKIETGTTKVQTSATLITNQISGVGIATVQAGGVVVTGIVTANSFKGDGSQLTGISAGLNASYARITDSKGSGTQGGSFTSGDWRTRDLQTEDEDPDGIVSISSNQFTLQAGTYYIKAQDCGINVNNHTAKIRNITDSSDTLIGNSNKTQPQGNNVSAYALVQGSFTIAAAKAFELQHRCSTTQTTHGFGAYNGFSTNVYATVEIYKRN